MSKHYPTTTQQDLEKAEREHRIKSGTPLGILTVSAAKILKGQKRRQRGMKAWLRDHRS